MKYSDEIADEAITPGGELDNQLLEDEYLKSEKGKMNTLQFCINLMKGIAGTGSLSIPYAFKMVGIIPGLFLFFLVCCMMILATYQLLEINNNMGNRRILGLKSIKTNNVYAEMVYNVLGTSGYRAYVVFSLITLYGSNIGSLIAASKSLSQVPFTSGSSDSRYTISLIISTVICLILSILKDPTMLVPISTFGLVAIIVSYAVLVIFGWSKYKPSFVGSDLWPVSFADLLQNIGLFVYCMGFILFLLTQYKYIRRDCRKNVVRSTGVSITIMAIIYSFLGITLSQYYKNSEKGVQESIITSLPDGFALGWLLNLMMWFTVVGGFPLWMEPINETIEGDDVEHGKVFISSRKYLILRTVEIVLMGLVACLVPSFADVLSLIGNFTDVLTTFIFPAVMHIVFFRNRTSTTIMGLDMATLVVSVIIMIICTSLSLKKFFK